MDQAAKGLASQDRKAAAAGLSSLSKALRRAAQKGKGKIQALGKMDSELSQALEDLRKQKSRRVAKAGQGDARAGGRGSRPGTGPRPDPKGRTGAAGGTGKPGSGPSNVQRGKANRTVGLDPAERRRRAADRAAAAGGKGRGGALEGDPRNTRTGARGGSLVRRGAPPVVPFTPATEDPGQAYRREVGEYLARENVPREYQEMIKRYFGGDG